jgi:hypothetical protein
MENDERACPVPQMAMYVQCQLAENQWKWHCECKLINIKYLSDIFNNEEQ